MGDPWGPPKRKVTPISEWFSSWPAVAGQYINAEWIDGKPVYTQENFQVLLQAMDSAGSLHHLVNTAGEITVENPTAEASLVQAALNAALGAAPTVGPLPSSYANGSWAHHRHGTLGAMTLAGGALADHLLFTAQAGYYGVIHLIGLWSDTSDTYTLAFEDETAVDLLGLPAAIDVAVTAGQVTWLHGMTGWAAADDRDIRVDVSGGAGAEELYLIYTTSQET